MDIFEKGEKLPLIDEFYTIQGEGYHTGKAAYFIRIGGCDIGCKWCDTKISWKADLHKLEYVDNIINNILGTPAKTLVITGGEPLNYNLDYLCSKVKSNNIKTFLETSGTKKITGKWDWICLSPKQQNPPLEENYKRADELKVIISEKSDINWAEKCSGKINSGCKLYLQPEWSKSKSITYDIIDYIKNNPNWNISIQMHKYLRIP